MNSRRAMLSTFVVLALTQTGAGEKVEPPESAESWLQRVTPAEKIDGQRPLVMPSLERRQLRFDLPVRCIDLAPSTKVPSGKYRVQCDEQSKTCLAAPDRVTRNGVESDELLARTAECTGLFGSELSRLGAGYTFLDAVAEVPDGWYRDDDGRVVQVNFDLHRRVYFGGEYAPSFHPRESPTASFGRARAEFGIEVEIAAGARNSELHRLHFIDGSAWLGSDTRIDATAIRYDFSVQRSSAPLWLTTFVGRPRRFDLDINLTAWFEALRFELISDKSYLTLASAEAMVDIWHSRDLQSYVRVRAGPAAELDLQTKGVALRPEATVETDLTLDADGFHHFTAGLTGEKLLFESAIDGRALHPQRLKMRAGYELILLAINDYPLTLVVEGRAQWRDDLPSLAPGWDFGGNVGLRFSFWAPARRGARQVGALTARHS